VVEQDKIAGCYYMPVELKTNECLSCGISIVSDSQIHWAGIKHREFRILGNEPDVIQYASFNFVDKRWTIAVELTKGYKESEKLYDSFSIPSLACDKEQIYCAWARQVKDVNRENITKRTEESGIYFCSKTNNQWDKPAKMADSGDNPRVVVDNNSTVHLFWLEENKGLFHKFKTDNGWSDTNMILTDNRIRQPLRVIVDKGNDLHIIYIRERSDTIYGKTEFKPEELVYVKLKHRP
jgi:hypothetical protein